MTDAIRREIHSFENLPDGWHFGEGVGAVEAAVKAALDVHSLMIENGIETIKAFPEIDGGIMVSGYLKEESLEVLDVSCRPDGEMEMDHEVDNVDVFGDTKRGLNLNDVEKYLEKLNWRKNGLYEYCIRDISVKIEKDLQVRLFVLPVVVGEFQSLASAVPVKPATASAVISKNSIKISRGNLSYFGELNPKTYQSIRFSVRNGQQPGMIATATSGNWEEASVGV